MRSITKIIIHCSATPPDMDIGADEIRTWHTRDNGWLDIGYHWVIRRDGKIEAGRPEEQQGAHCAAQNGNKASIGICMVGGVEREDGKLVAHDNFTAAQWRSLLWLVKDRLHDYPAVDTILGHRDLDNGKECPSFSVRDWLQRECVMPRALWK